MTVNIKENTVDFDGGHYDIQPGQRITSTKTLAAEMNFTWRTTNKILNQLEDRDMVRINHIGKAFIVTVVNFKKYQNVCSRAEVRADMRADKSLLESRKVYAREQTNKEKKKDKELKKGLKPSLKSFWENPE